MQNTGNFSDDEVLERVEVVKQIVEAAFSIQGKILSSDNLFGHTKEGVDIVVDVGKEVGERFFASCPAARV